MAEEERADLPGALHFIQQQAQVGRVSASQDRPTAGRVQPISVDMCWIKFVCSLYAEATWMGKACGRKAVRHREDNGTIAGRLSVCYETEWRSNHTSTWERQFSSNGASWAHLQAAIRIGDAKRVKVPLLPENY